MKKLMIAVSAAALCGAVMADVGSNTVGFFAKAQGSADDFKVISFQWDAIDGQEKTLQEVIKPTMAGKAWASAEDEECIPGWTDTAPMIQVRDASGGYNIAWYAELGYDLDTEEMYPAWCDPQGFVLKGDGAVVTIGQAAWILNQTEQDGEFITSGGVAGEETPVGGKADVFLLQGGAFPVAFDINDTAAVEWSLIGAKAWASAEDEECIPGWTDNAPTVQIRDENGGYDIAWYAELGYDLDTEEMYPAWCDPQGFVIKNMIVPVGAGFWLWAPESAPNVYVTVKNPVK